MPITEDAYRDRLRADGLDDHAVAVASAGLSAIRTGSEALPPTACATCSDATRAPFEDYVRRTADAWR